MASSTRTLSGDDMPAEMTSLVRALMPLLLAGDDELSRTLRIQYARSRIASIDLTGVGFFADFDIDKAAPRAVPAELAGGSVDIELEGVRYGAGCLIFVRDGLLQFLEGYTYDDIWPE